MIFYKHLILMLFIGLAFGSYGQDADTMVEWDPRGTRYIIQIQPYYLESNQSNKLNFGMGGRLDYYLPKVVSLHASFKKALYDLNNYNANIKGFKDSENNTGLFGQAEAGIGLYFNYDGYAKSRVYAWPGTGFFDQEERDTIYDYTRESLPCRTMIGLRGGYYGWTQSVDNSQPANGLTGTDVITGQKKVFSDSLSLYSTMKVNAIYAGISISRLVDVSYHSAMGRRNTSFIRNVYIDVLYSPTVSLDRVVYKGSAYDIIGTGGFKKQNLGGRIVLEKVGTLDIPKLNFSYRLEFGVRPGFERCGMYLMQTIGLGFAK